MGSRDQWTDGVGRGRNDSTNKSCWSNRRGNKQQRPAVRDVDTFWLLAKSARRPLASRIDADAPMMPRQASVLTWSAASVPERWPCGASIEGEVFPTAPESRLTSNPPTHANLPPQIHQSAECIPRAGGRKHVVEGRTAGSSPPFQLCSRSNDPAFKRAPPS